MKRNADDEIREKKAILQAANEGIKQKQNLAVAGVELQQVIDDLLIKEKEMNKIMERLLKDEIDRGERNIASSAKTA